MSCRRGLAWTLCCTMLRMNKEQMILSLVPSELQIDASGQIWRVAVRGGRPDRGAFAVRPCEPRRTEYRQRQGYLLVAVTIAGVKYVTGAHRLVWTHLNGPIPSNLIVNHKNGIKDDNRPENLELATESENRFHALEVLSARRHRPTGSAHPKTQLSEDDVREIRRLRDAGEMVKVIADRYAMKPKAVSAICNRVTWKHI